MSKPLAGSRIATIGGGIIGLATARASARAGGRVTLYERDQVGGGATDAASGLITLGWRGRSSLRRLKRAGYHAMERWLPELAPRMAPGSAERRRAIRLFETVPPTHEKLLATWIAAGHDARYLEPEEAAALVPGLDPASFALALQLDQEWVVDPPALVAALREDFLEAGGVLHEQVGSLSVLPAGPDEIAVVDASGASIAEEADHVLVASGWQSVAALAALPDPALAVAPVGGIGLDLPVEMAPVTVHFGEKGRTHLIRRGEGRAYLGSTVREEGSVESAQGEESRTLLDRAFHHFPHLAGCAVTAVRDGLRPKAQRRGGPFLGSYPGRRRLWIATGHYRLGVATAAATAEQLVAAWSGGEPIDPDLSVARGLE